MQLARWNWLAMALLAGAFCASAGDGLRSTNRSDSLRALCQQLDVGQGAVVADVGCGEGLDSVVFARVVGERGTVLAQEIDAGKLKVAVQVVGKHGLHQVVPVLGQSDDPRLPDGFADLVYMNRVFHHFAQPRAMLDRLWRDLKPGGRLVIVDQQKGPLTDWAPVESREDQHHWTGETAVVRLAREAGFLFHDVCDGLWHEKSPFVLVFRKPLDPLPATGDPDLPHPLDARALVRTLSPTPPEGAAVVFFGLDRGRAVASALREAIPPSSHVFDVVLDEWALSREELPTESRSPGLEILRTEKNQLPLPAEIRIGWVVFVDAYHRLWEPLPLLRQLGAHMLEPGRLAVVERHGPDDEPRRVAGHRRRLASARVIEDLRQAGFELQQTLPAPTEDRYGLLFQRRSPATDRPPDSRPNAEP
jgi:SAM-dependent methyltransferase